MTYCTGGIRCEKATAYMIGSGFTDVYQLKDGIINFCQQYPDTVWEGKCFVFDDRLVSDVEAEGEVISRCTVCGESSDRYQNCRNPVCDDLVILCLECSEENEGCCSHECLGRIPGADPQEDPREAGVQIENGLTILETNHHQAWGST